MRSERVGVDAEFASFGSKSYIVKMGLGIPCTQEQNSKQSLVLGCLWRNLQELTESIGPTFITYRELANQILIFQLGEDEPRDTSAQFWADES